jgi:hypothetical protein
VPVPEVPFTLFKRYGHCCLSLYAPEGALGLV